MYVSYATIINTTMKKNLCSLCKIYGYVTEYSSEYDVVIHFLNNLKLNDVYRACNRNVTYNQV